jgi:hypothetical protein
VKARSVLLIIAGLIVSLPVFAHHGSAAYDNAKSLSIKGVVTEYNFVNPHVEIFIDAKNANGDIEKWQGELNSPNLLAHRGWSRSTIKVGEEVTLVGFPAKSGAKSLRLEKVLGPDGKPLGDDSATE